MRHTKVTTRFVFTAIVLLTAHRGNSTALAFDEGHQVTFSQRIVPVSMFTADRLIEIGQREAAQQHGLMTLWFFTSEKAAEDFWSNSLTTERDFDAWARINGQLTTLPWRVGRFISFQGSSLLQTRDETGGIYRRVVSGTDVLSIKEDGVFIDVVGLAGRTPSRDEPLPDLFIYARSYGDLSEASVRLIWNRFRGLSARLISIVVRVDPWFVEDLGQPVFDPFESRFRLPVEAEVAQLRSLHCLGRPGATAPPCHLWIGDRPAKR